MQDIPFSFSSVFFLPSGSPPGFFYFRRKWRVTSNHLNYLFRFFFPSKHIGEKYLQKREKKTPLFPGKGCSPGDFVLQNRIYWDLEGDVISLPLLVVVIHFVWEKRPLERLHQGACAEHVLFKYINFREPRLFYLPERRRCRWFTGRRGLWGTTILRRRLESKVKWRR